MSEGSSSPRGQVELSVIIPAFNEEQRLPAAIPSLEAHLDQLNLSAEVLIIENGSTDRTFEVADGFAANSSRVRALHLPERGKGRAARHGMLAATGKWLVLCDADFSMPVEYIERLVAALQGGADVAIASREVAGAVRIGEPWHRHAMGRVFNALVRWLMLPGIQDSQCGFKAFRREAAQDLFAHETIDGWTFDVEVLYMARRRGYRIVEVPIPWRYDASSRVQPVRDTIGMLRELLMLRWRAARGAYEPLHS
ncbi:MAG TPA: dolichyl-phosphate beta-glucosyltransferase [Chloroflexota bacterium]